MINSEKPAICFLLGLLLTGCPDPSPATVSFHGKSLRVAWVRTGYYHADVLKEFPALDDHRAILVSWGIDRPHHYFSTGYTSACDVLFLDNTGKILEHQVLPADSSGGITSQSNARYALFLRDGWAKRQGVTYTGQVELSPSITQNPAESIPEIHIAGHALHAEVSILEPQRQRGLMHRSTMGPDDAMLFVFGRDRPCNFWMLNCHFGLDIAYFRRDGTLINVVPTDPYPDPTVDPGTRSSSKDPAAFAVETHKGWFQARGLINSDGLPTRTISLEMPAAVRTYIAKASP